MKNAPGGVRTRDLRIASAPSAVVAGTAYKYDALTDCATGARQGRANQNSWCISKLRGYLYDAGMTFIPE